MDLRALYDRFIESRRGRQGDLDRYERHHVVPRHLGGTDDPNNLVKLTPEDHLFAHVLLGRIHGGAMATCVVRMLGMKKYAGRRSRLEYRSLRDEHRENMRAVDVEKRRHAGRMSHVSRTPERLEQMRANCLKMTAERPPMSQDQKEKAATALRALDFDSDDMARRARIGHKKRRASGAISPLRGRPKSEETRRRMSEAAQSRRTDMARRGRVSAAKRWGDRDDD